MAFRFIRVVRATAELQVVARRLAAVRVRDDVIELEKPTFPTAPLRSDKSALSRVAPPDLTFDRRWNVSRPRCGLARSLRSHRRRELRLLEFCHEQRQGAIEDRRGVRI